MYPSNATFKQSLEMFRIKNNQSAGCLQKLIRYDYTAVIIDSQVELNIGN
jgi:hypothetical protein